MAQWDLNRLLIPLVLVAVLIVGDIFIYYFSSSHSSRNTGNDKVIQGIGSITLKLEGYKRILKVNRTLSQDEIEKVKGYINDYQLVENKTILFLNNDSYVNKIASLLNNNAYATAIFVPASKLYYAGRLFNVSISVQLEVKPLFKKGALINVTIPFAASGGKVFALGSPNFEVHNIALTFPLELIKTKAIYYKSIVDFANRTKITSMNCSCFEKHISNIVFVNSSLLNKKDYVDYVGDGYIEVKPNFTNKTRIMQDYGNVTFKDSYIISKNPLNLSFAKKELVVYENLYKINLKHYNVLNDTIILNVSNNKTQINVSAYAIISGNNILQYKIKQEE